MKNKIINQLGFIQIPIILGLLLIAAILPTSIKLVQQNQNPEKKATEEQSTCTKCETAECNQCSTKSDGWRCSCTDQIMPNIPVYKSCKGIKDESCKASKIEIQTTTPSLITDTKPPIIGTTSPPPVLSTQTSDSAVPAITGCSGCATAACGACSSTDDRYRCICENSLGNGKYEKCQGQIVQDCKKTTLPQENPVPVVEIKSPPLDTNSDQYKCQSLNTCSGGTSCNTCAHPNSDDWYCKCSGESTNKTCVSDHNKSLCCRDECELNKTQSCTIQNEPGTQKCLATSTNGCNKWNDCQKNIQAPVEIAPLINKSVNITQPVIIQTCSRCETALCDQCSPVDTIKGWLCECTEPVGGGLYKKCQGIQSDKCKKYSREKCNQETGNYNCIPSNTGTFADLSTCQIGDINCQKKQIIDTPKTVSLKTEEVVTPSTPSITQDQKCTDEKGVCKNINDCGTGYHTLDNFCPSSVSAAIKCCVSNSMGTIPSNETKNEKPKDDPLINNDCGEHKNNDIWCDNGTNGNSKVVICLKGEVKPRDYCNKDSEVCLNNKCVDKNETIKNTCKSPASCINLNNHEIGGFLAKICDDFNKLGNGFSYKKGQGDCGDSNHLCCTEENKTIFGIFGGDSILKDCGEHKNNDIWCDKGANGKSKVVICSKGEIKTRDYCNKDSEVCLNNECVDKSEKTKNTCVKPASCFHLIDNPINVNGELAQNCTDFNKLNNGNKYSPNGKEHCGDTDHLCCLMEKIFTDCDGKPIDSIKCESPYIYMECTKYGWQQKNCDDYKQEFCINDKCTHIEIPKKEGDLCVEGVYQCPSLLLCLSNKCVKQEIAFTAWDNQIPCKPTKNGLLNSVYDIGGSNPACPDGLSCNRKKELCEKPTFSKGSKKTGDSCFTDIECVSTYCMPFGGAQVCEDDSEREYQKKGNIVGGILIGTAVLPLTVAALPEIIAAANTATLYTSVITIPNILAKIPTLVKIAQTAGTVWSIADPVVGLAACTKDPGSSICLNYIESAASMPGGPAAIIDELGDVGKSLLAKVAKKTEKKAINVAAQAVTTKLNNVTNDNFNNLLGKNVGDYGFEPTYQGQSQRLVDNEGYSIVNPNDFDNALINPIYEKNLTTVTVPTNKVISLDTTRDIVSNNNPEKLSWELSDHIGVSQVRDLIQNGQFDFNNVSGMYGQELPGGYYMVTGGRHRVTGMFMEDIPEIKLQVNPMASQTTFAINPKNMSSNESIIQEAIDNGVIKGQIITIDQYTKYLVLDQPTVQNPLQLFGDPVSTNLIDVMRQTLSP